MNGVGEARRARAERCGVWRCAWCHAGFEAGAEPRAACRGCLALHHAACWDEAGACATCREPQALRERGEPTTRRAAEEGAARALAAKDAVVAGRAVRWAAGSLAVALGLLAALLATALAWASSRSAGLDLHDACELLSLIAGAVLAPAALAAWLGGVALAGPRAALDWLRARGPSLVTALAGGTSAVAGLCLLDLATCAATPRDEAGGMLLGWGLAAAVLLVLRTALASRDATRREAVTSPAGVVLCPRRTPGGLERARVALTRAPAWLRGHAPGLLAGGVWLSLVGAVCALGEPRGQERLAVALAWLLTSWLCLLGWCWAGRRAGRRYGAGAGTPRRTTIAYHTPAEPRRPA